MNLLYVQVIDDIDRGWLLCTDEEKDTLNKLQVSSSAPRLLRESQRRLSHCKTPNFQNLEVWRRGQNINLTSSEFAFKKLSFRQLLEKLLFFRIFKGSWGMVAKSRSLYFHTICYRISFKNNHKD